MSDMQAWQSVRVGTPLESLELNAVSLPAPNGTDIVVQSLAIGVGLPDVLMCRDAYVFSPPRPFSPGQEVAGVVLDPGSSSFSVGEKIMGVTAFYTGFGSFAEQCLVIADSAWPVPSTMPDQDAAGFIIPFHTAWIALKTRGQLLKGETLVVLGAAGGSGIAAVQLGKALGAKVIAVAGNADKAALCSSLGADHVIDHSKTDVSAAVLELTGGKGAELIFDPVGGAAFDQAVNYIASEGRLLTVGYASGTWSSVSAEAMVMKNASVMGVFVGAYDYSARSQVQHELIELYKNGALKVNVDDTNIFDFSDIPMAMEKLNSRAISGKIIARAPSAQS